MRLQHLVIHSDRSVKLAALQALANMALNTTNQKEMEVSWHFTIFNWRDLGICTAHGLFILIVPKKS